MIKLYLVMFIILTPMRPLPNEFKLAQLRMNRVQTAYEEKEKVLKNLLEHNQIVWGDFEIFFRAFKEEQKLELWAKNTKEESFRLIKIYPFCKTSGTLGPKRKSGDLQIPEGFYEITRFNPQSNFYLSLGINYPNASDKILGNKINPGGDIFIHGNCVTIGCIPVTDDKIKEIYVLAVEAKNNGQQKIQVHIFPSQMDDINYSKLMLNNRERYPDLAFWENLRPGYLFFEANKKLPVVSVLHDGRYKIGT